MLSLLFSSAGGYLIGGVVIVALIGGAVGYVRHNETTITDLREQMTVLKVQSANMQAAYKALQIDILNVQRAEDAANQQIADIRNRASIAVQAAQKRKYTDSPSTQVQVNEDTSDLFKQLEAISRAK